MQGSLNYLALPRENHLILPGAVDTSRSEILMRSRTSADLLSKTDRGSATARASEPKCSAQIGRSSHARSKNRPLSTNVPRHPLRIPIFSICSDIDERAAMDTRAAISSLQPSTTALHLRNYAGVSELTIHGVPDRFDERAETLRPKGLLHWHPHRPTLCECSEDP